MEFDTKHSRSARLLKNKRKTWEINPVERVVKDKRKKKDKYKSNYMLIDDTDY